LVLLWLAAGLLLVTATVVPGVVGQAADVMACRLLPASIRRIAVGALGLSLTTSVAACSGISSTAVATTAAALPVAAASPADPASRDPAAAQGPPARSGQRRPTLDPARHDTGVDWPIGTPTTAPPPTPVSTGGQSSPGRAAGSGGPTGAPAHPHPSARSGAVPRRSPAPTASPAASGRSTAPGPRPRPGDPVTVRAGDCLWFIAARHLDPGATPAQVGAETRRWYAANAARIGADPDLLRPGQVLAAPIRQGP
jgi:hypothetical protein